MSPGYSLNDALKQKKEKPLPRFVLLGEKKVGKTITASKAPNVVFIPSEKGSDGIDVPKLVPPGRPRCETWEDVLGMVRLLLDTEHKFEWLTIDTIDEVVQFCAAHVCARDFGGQWTTKKSTEGFDSYGKGDRAVAQEFRQLLALLDNLQERKRMGIILLSHDALHKAGNALGSDYYKLGGNMGKAWPLVADWADQIGYATRENRIAVRGGEQRAKVQAISSERYIIFDGGPGLDTGTRAGYEMPARILLDWDEYAKHLGNGVDYLDALIAQAKELLTSATKPARDKMTTRLGGKVSDEALRALGKSKLEAAINWLLSQTEQTQQQPTAGN